MPMTTIEMLAAIGGSGVTGVAAKSLFDYLTGRGQRKLSGEDRLWARIAKLEEHMAKCDAANDALLREVGSLKAQNATQAAEIVALRADNRRLSGQCSALHAELTSLRRQIA